MNRASLDELAREYQESPSAVAALKTSRALVDAPAGSFVAQSRIALVGSHTLDHLPPHIQAQAAGLRIGAAIYASPFGQYAQEILNPNSNLWTFNPDVVLVCVLPEALGFDRDAFDAANDETLAQWVQRRSDFFGILDAAVAHASALVVISNMEVPWTATDGLLATRQRRSFSSWLGDFNRELAARYAQSANAFVMDLDALSAEIGKRNSRDSKMWHYARMPFSEAFLPRIAREVARYSFARAGLTRKCVALDLDNTLWKGIVGEDGVSGIKLDPSHYPGAEFYAFQSRLLALQRRGILLAICSKNNPEDALEAIRNHPHMLLREKHFAAIRINWEPKESNLTEIARELNIGLDSLVFIDDNPAEIARVRAALPDVVAVQLPKNTADYAATLDNLVFFDSLRMTETDKLRSELYQQQRLRETERRAAGTVEEFLAGLGVVIDGHQARPSELPRIAQLFQRTNQFNTTTRRYTERDVQSFSASPGHRLYAFEVQDRFGAHGLTGVALVDTSTSGIWRLDSLVLSCRVLGLTVEKAIGLKLARDARRAGARALRGDFRPTPKNTPAAGYFANMGYTLIEKQSDLCVWELQLGSSIPDYDAWIEFREESVTTPEEQT